MKAMKVLKTLVVFGLVSVGLFLLAACTDTNGKGDGLTGGIAATVNGVEILEDDITKEIQNYRTAYELLDEDAWGEYLVMYGTDPAGVREDILDRRIEEELTRQAIEEKEIKIDVAEVDERADRMRVYYETEEDWNAALEGAGLTEESYRAGIELSLQKIKLRETVAPLGAPEDADADEVLNYIKLYIESFDGAKRSAHILFESDDEKAAQEILDKINAGELDFAQAAKENSKDTSAENGGDVGWDRLATFVEAYQGALDELELNQVSGLVASEYGIHIIKCTEVFAAPEEITEESQVPQEYVEAIRNMIQGMNQEDTYAAWYEAFREAADIEINAMPEKVPYNLDIEKYAVEHEGDEGFDLEDYLNMTGEDWSSEQEGSEEGEGENPEAAEGAPNS